MIRCIRKIYFSTHIYQFSFIALNDDKMRKVVITDKNSDYSYCNNNNYDNMIDVIMIMMVAMAIFNDNDYYYDNDDVRIYVVVMLTVVYKVFKF